MLTSSTNLVTSNSTVAETLAITDTKLYAPIVIPLIQDSA